MKYRTIFLARAQKFSKEHTQPFDDRKAFYDFFTPKNSQNPEIHGGFAVSPWCGKEACELKLKDELGVTIRCLPFEQENSKGSCICCGKPGNIRAVFAKAY